MEHLLVKSDIPVSALSPGVKHLLCKVGVYSDSYKKGFNFSGTNAEFHDIHLRCKTAIEDDFINTNKLALLLPTDIEPASEYYKESVATMAPVFRYCEEILEDVAPEVFEDKYGHHFTWTKNKNLFLHCFELLSHRDCAHDILALLLMCGGLERALGNVCLLKSNQCPAMLKDLLTTPELENLLGASAVKILHIIIGPPTSMNIRNISWHGFLSENELPRRYIYFLLLLTASLGELLEFRGINPNTIPSRDYVSLDKVENIAKRLGLHAVDISEVEKCILNGWLVNRTNSHLFKSAFSFWRNQQYGLCTVQLLPLLEHALRRIFVTANNCPDRLVTAEATTLYTTFEEILACSLPAGSTNIIIDILGTSCLDLLHDLLIYPSGPKARDKLGHGEADYSSASETLANIVLLLLTYLTEKVEQAAGISEKTASTLSNCLLNYTSVFHPLAILQQKIQELPFQVYQLHQCLRTSPNLEPWEATDGYELFIEKNELFAQSQENFVQFLDSVVIKHGTVAEEDMRLFHQRLTQPFHDVVEDVKSFFLCPIPTLYRWQKDAISGSVQITESEIVGLLMAIVSDVATCLTQTKSTLQLRQDQLDHKQLRSRQRENMKRLLSFLPCEGLFANYIMMMTTWIVSHLGSYQQLDNTACRLIQRNKWGQAAETVLEQLQTAVKFSATKVFSSLRKCEQHLS